LKTEAEQIEAMYDATEELPEHADRRLGEIEALIAEIEHRPMIYDPTETARAGTFVSIDGTGELRIERGYVRPEDEPPVASTVTDPGDGNDAAEPRALATESALPATAAPEQEALEEDEGVRPLSDKLLSELTAHRTLALRDAVGAHPATAFAAVLHVLCLRLFYRYGLDSCLEIDAKSATLSGNAPGLADTPSAARIDARHRRWAERMPKEPSDLWDVLIALDLESQQALFAHCASLTINAVHEAWNRRPRAMAQARRLAEAVSLDMVEAGWSATADNFFGRVTKARILAAVREAKGEAHAERIADLKKADMAAQAEQILAGSGWLPEPLRTPGTDRSSRTVDASEDESNTALDEWTAAEGALVSGPEADQLDSADGSADRQVAAE
jgi:ParB family chromosome partitioning protein